MKARIQSVEQLKKIATQQLEAEFDARCEAAILAGAVQGMAFVMYTLETCQNWKGVRQKRLFQDMLSLVQMSQAAPWLKPYQAEDIKKHIEDEFGIDFTPLLENLQAAGPE